MTNREIILHCLNEESEITCRFSPCDKPEKEGNTECCKKCSLNILEEYENEIYDKAIDDFDNAIKDFVSKNGTIPNNFNSDFIAEQLKRGGENG